MKIHRALACSLTLAALTGCASQDIPQAHKGRLFDRTGPLALWIGGKGFKGPVLKPGTYFTGTYNEIYMVDCSMVTMREPLTALTKDGVQFGIDIYVRFSADCSDDTVASLLSSGVPDRGQTISAERLYAGLVRPAVGEAVRQVVSPYRANDLNEKREDLLTGIRKRFLDIMEAREKHVINVYEVNLSNLDFPDAMDAANVDRAVQGVLKDKAIAERERVQAEIQTMAMRRELAEREGEVAAAKIEKVGAALRKNPEYMQYDLQQKMPEIYKTAGANGNLVIAAPGTSVITPGRTAPAMETPRVNDGPPAQRANPLTGHEARQTPHDP
jgi:regulator of protease activity HflC (stomatin/prohibitin superfamily)